MFEGRFWYQKHIIDQFGDDLAGELPRRLHGNAFRQRIAATGTLVTRYCRIHRWVEFGLNTDHFDIGLERSGHGGHPAHQSAAPDRYDKTIEIVLVLDHLQRDRALPGRNQRIIERVDKG